MSDDIKEKQENENQGLSLELEGKPEIQSEKPSGGAADRRPETGENEEEGGNKKRIGDRLVEQGVITRDQLNVALYEKQKSGKMMGEVMVDLGFISADMLTSFLAESMGYQEYDPKKVMLDPEALEKISKKDALKYQILPVSIDKKKDEVIVAMADPYDVVALDKLKQAFPRKMTIIPQICSPAVLADTIHNAYGHATSIDAILKELAGDQEAAKGNLENLNEEDSYSHPIVRLVNAIVFEAVKMGASDIHLEPEENFVRVRNRLDGDLATYHTIHREYWNGICQRIKIVSGMNIADKMMPQDGRFGVNIGGREADFRVSTIPTVNGENIVMRILDKNAGIVPMEKLGFSEHNMRLIQKALNRPEGIIIVTGPTGSGKTTSLYSMLNTINTIDVNIMTLEDPVEYSLGLIRQSSVREGTGFTFGEGIKALLRQDPDIIFIGEVRDHVTAEQALKAAMTGHQVFTTLHTNDSFGAIPRLLDLGLKPGMIAGAIIACFAQRLVRRLCPDCREAYTATEEECKMLEVDPADPPTLYRPKGCPECGNTGFKGRVAVVEILYMDEDLDDIIAANGHKSELKAMARKKGFKSMLDDGVIKILEGTTTIDQVSKVVNFADRM